MRLRERRTSLRLDSLKSSLPLCKEAQPPEKARGQGQVGARSPSLLSNRLASEARSIDRPLRTIRPAVSIAEGLGGEEGVARESVRERSSRRVPLCVPRLRRGFRFSGLPARRCGPRVFARRRLGAPFKGSPRPVSVPHRGQLSNSQRSASPRISAGLRYLLENVQEWANLNRRQVDTAREEECGGVVRGASGAARTLSEGSVRAVC